MFVAFALVFVVAAAAQTQTGGGLAAAPARSATASSPNVNLEMKDVDIRSAVEALFRNAGKNYTIDQDVTGTVSSLSIKDVPFDAALKNLTKSVGLIFRVDNNGEIYHISKRPEVSGRDGIGGSPMPAPPIEPPVEADDTIIEKIPLNYTSATEILAMLGSGGTTARDYGYPTFSSYMGGPGSYGGMNTFGNFGGMGNYPSYGGGYPSYGGGYPSYGGGYPSYGGSSPYRTGTSSTVYSRGYSAGVVQSR
jgi:hypothetical protein